MKLIKKLKHKITVSLHDYTDYILKTTPEQRKVARKKDRAQRRAKRLKGLREFRPFNWKLLQKWQDRSQRRAEFVQPEPATAE